MVLAGGPDREQPVSLISGAQVNQALKQAGHEVLQCDIGPQDLSALDKFMDWQGDVIFPVLHGAWGEGGPLQSVLDQRSLCYVGCRSTAARAAMNKVQTKELMVAHRLPTPAYETLESGRRRTLAPPLVLKPPAEGSSIDIAICRDNRQARLARTRLGRRHAMLLAEAFIDGLELTVGVLEMEKGIVALPPIQIVAATDFYDFEAKYDRDDTQYLFDIDLPQDVLDRARELAIRTHYVVGCRHMSRVDFVVDVHNEPWILEINTIPGFTTHSLLPMAAAQAGIPMLDLVDRLVRLAWEEHCESITATPRESVPAPLDQGVTPPSRQATASESEPAAIV